MTTPFAFGDGLYPTQPFTLLEHIIMDRGSRYSVSYGLVRGRDDIRQFLKTVKASKQYAKADHHSFAARLVHEGAIYETKSDDGETGAGLVILRLMQGHDVRDGVICVTRWFGGTKLEGDRFKHIKDATLIAIADMTL